MSYCRTTGSTKVDFEKLDCNAQPIWVRHVLTVVKGIGMIEIEMEMANVFFHYEG